MVEAITSMDEDFSKWCADVVKKAELIDYSSVKGCTVIRPYGYATVSYTHLDVYKRQSSNSSIWETRMISVTMGRCV